MRFRVKIIDERGKIGKCIQDSGRLGDVSEALVRDLDYIRNRIGVDRSALIKIWLHERVKQETAVS
jgi:hypothetical protein